MGAGNSATGIWRGTLTYMRVDMFCWFIFQFQCHPIPFVDIHSHFICYHHCFVSNSESLMCFEKRGNIPSSQFRFVWISYCFPRPELMGAKEDPRLAPHLALMCSSFCCFGLVWVDISFQCPVQRGDGHGIESPFGMITYLESHFNPSEPLRGTQFWICSYL